jgi:hypothetical protein
MNLAGAAIQLRVPRAVDFTHAAGADKGRKGSIPALPATIAVAMAATWVLGE